MVELIRNYEPFCRDSVGQIEAGDYLGTDFEQDCFEGGFDKCMSDIVVETKDEKVFIILN
jgi:hypothetical protein